ISDSQASPFCKAGTTLPKYRSAPPCLEGWPMRSHFPEDPLRGSPADVNLFLRVSPQLGSARGSPDADCIRRAPQPRRLQTTTFSRSSFLLLYFEHEKLQRNGSISLLFSRRLLVHLTTDGNDSRRIHQRFQTCRQFVWIKFERLVRFGLQR